MTHTAFSTFVRRPEFWVPAACAFALGCATLGGSFVFDSKHIVLENGRLDSWSKLPALFLDNYWGEFANGGLYRPVTLISFGIERNLFGQTAWPYHLVNAVLYALVSGLLGTLARSLGARHAIAVAAGVLFAAHPIHSEPVANLVGRAELLALIGGVGLLIAAREASTRTSVLWGTASLSIGLFSKESAIASAAALALLPLFEPCSTGTNIVARWARGNRKRLPLWVGVGVVLVAWIALRTVAIEGEAEPTLPLNNVLAERSTVDRVAGALEVSLRYHAKSVAPWPLSADYSLAAIEPTSSLLSFGAIAGGLVLAGLLYLAARMVQSSRLNSPEHRLIGVGIALYVLPLLIIANVLFPTGTIFGERLLFAPSAGLCLATAGILTALPWPSLQRALPWAVAASLLSGGSLFMVRAWEWRTELSISEAIQRVQPKSAKGHEKYGHELFLLAKRTTDPAQRENLLDQAATSIERSIEIYEPNAIAYENLSLVERARGNLDAWTQHAERRHAIARNYASAIALARVYLDRANTPHENLERVRKALSVSDAWLQKSQYANSADFLRTRAESLMYLGRPTAALPILAALVRAQPDDVTLAPFIGLAKAMTGDIRGALPEFTRVINTAEDHPQYDQVIHDRASHLRNRARIYRETGQPDRARADQDQVREILERKIRTTLETDGVDAARVFLRQNKGLLDPADLEALNRILPLN